MKISGLYHSVVILSLFLTVSGGNTTSHHKRRKYTRCRCKRLLNDINKVIDNKFKHLEDRLLSNIPNIGNSLKLSDIDSKMTRLQKDVHFSQEALKRESRALRHVKEQIHAQKRSMDSLNANFGMIETVVRNLTAIVERLGHIVPSIGNSNQITSTPSTTISSTMAPTTSHPARPVELRYPKHCHEVFKQGGLRFIGDYYIMVQPEGAPKPMKVLCKTINDSGWTMIQRRLDGSVDFYRNWTEYKNGFGDLHGEFWLGNDNIYHLTNQGTFKLRINMEQWNGRKYYAIYDLFRVSNEADGYRLQVNGYHGTSGDSLTSIRDNHNGMRFSTYDRDNDRRIYNNCAMHFKGGWWFSDCYDSNLNGKFYPKGEHNDYFKRNGIQWNSIHPHSSLKFVEMMVKPADDLIYQNEV